MAEPTNSKSEDSSLQQHSLATKTNPQPKFTNNTTFSEVLMHDIMNLERQTLTNLKKDVLIDLNMYIINKHKNFPPVISNSAIDNLQSLEKKISEAEENLIKRATILEESILNKVNNHNHQKNNANHQKRQKFNSLDLEKAPNVITDPIVHHSDDYIDETCETALLNLCEGLDFKTENGHGVCSFGATYKYNKSKSDEPDPIPEPIKTLIGQLSAEFPDAANINQVLVNKLDGPDSYLPTHSDDEHSIAPGSAIYTISLGSSSKIKLTNMHTGEQRILSVRNRSLYVMSRKSQVLWSHGIEKCADFLGVRYSITMRTVGNRFYRSTIVQGDSNTKHLKFGQGKGTFGFNMPGEAVYTPVIANIDPWACVGYKNIIIHCGVNDIKNDGIHVPDCAA